MIVLAVPWLLLVLPLPILVHWLLPDHRERRDAVYAPFVGVLSELTGRSSESIASSARRTAAQALTFGLGWILVVLALARPQLVGAPIERVVPTRDLLLAVDLSGSMDTEDFTTATGERVDRLTAVQSVLDDFLARRVGDRVGLILFGSAAFVQVPFTEDLDACRQLLDEAEVRMAGPRTVIGDAIGLAITVFETSEQDDRVLILLTDGNDTDSRVPPAKAAEIAADRGITIHTVAVGDPAAVGEQAIDEEGLRAVSETTGGVFARANDRDELEDVYARLDALEARDVEVTSARPTSELYHWPLGAMFALVVAFHGVMAVPRWLRMRPAGGAT